jgi:hypothetical protein
MDIIKGSKIDRNWSFPIQCGKHSLSLKSMYRRLGALIQPLNKNRSLADVLENLDACKMTSTHKRDRISRYIKRGALVRAVRKCGADVRRSLETFRVRVCVFKLAHSDGSGRLRF